MAFIDYYKILKIDKNASDEEVKKAYRKMARKLHPDLNPKDKDAQKKFQQINEANQVLSDPEKRKKYDKYGKDWEHADQFEQQRGARYSSSRNERQPFNGGNEGDFSSFFDSMFGGGARTSKLKGEDYNSELKLNLSDALETRRQTFTVNGRAIRITIPAGVEHGQVIRLKGHGAPGVNGGPAGDLYITFKIEDHPIFKRTGNDLYASVLIDLYTAVLGGETMIDTLDGKVKLKVKAGTQHGTKVRLKGKGFPVYKKEGERGDMYISYEVGLPTTLTEEQEKLFVELSKL
ncbi:MAG: J domain-containing protein [Chryseolinea sp.]